MENWKSNRDPSNPQEAYYVGLMNSCGYRIKDLHKPAIGIANSYTDVNPGHRAFGELVKFVKEGIWAAGGIPAEFNVPAPCDGMAQGTGMHYILPERDLIAGSIEAMADAHSFDGMVFLCSCDKIVPGMLMAAASLNKPTMFLTAGSMLPYPDCSLRFPLSLKAPGLLPFRRDPGAYLRGKTPGSADGSRSQRKSPESADSGDFCSILG